jgi:hypothetical protein
MIHLARRLESLLLLLIGLHSFILGIAMLFLPARTLLLFGWDYQGPMFFPTQTGAFLALFGILFVAMLRYRSIIWFVIVVKSVAVIFLTSQWIKLGSDAPVTVPLAAVFDGLMGASVAAILIWKAYLKKTAKIQQI